MWQTKYALAVPKTWGVGVDFRPCGLKAISSPGVRSPCRKLLISHTTIKITLYAEKVMTMHICYSELVNYFANVQCCSLGNYFAT